MRAIIEFARMAGSYKALVHEPCMGFGKMYQPLPQYRACSTTLLRRLALVAAAVHGGLGELRIQGMKSLRSSPTSMMTR